MKIREDSKLSCGDVISQFVFGETSYVLPENNIVCVCVGVVRLR